jgi:lysozyme
LEETGMKTSQPGVELVKSFEGLHLQAYQDPVGIPTIGYGTTIIDGDAVQMGATISEDEANDYLIADLEASENFVNKLVTQPLTQPQFDACVSFVYNLGPGNFRKSTLLRMINNGDIESAQPQFLRWNRAGGNVLRGLTRRRLAEATLFGPMDRDTLIDTYNLDV